MSDDVTGPLAPDGSELTPEEWDAVRRLRGERGAPTAQPVQTPQPTETAPIETAPAQTSPTEPQATAAPLPPVEPVPPAAETAPPVTQTGVTETDGSEPVEQQPTPAPAVGDHPDENQPPSPAAAAVPALAALVVLAVVSVVLAALVGLRVSDNHSRDSASTAALAAATTGVATVLSYNYRSLDADFAKAEALLTPSFRKAYDSTTAKAVQPLAAKYQAVSTAQVSAAGILTVSASKATVLVFVSQQVTNTQLSAPRLDRSRIQVELVHSHGKWLINKLTPV